MSDLLHPSTGPISMKDLQELAAAPIDNGERTSKVWLPLGKRAAPRGHKPTYECEFAPSITNKEVRERHEAEKDKKLGSLLNYYATTSTPFESIAKYLKLDLVTVIRAMKARGRLS